MESTHQGLVDIAELWLQKKCGIVFAEYNAGVKEIPDVIGFRKDGMSIMIECKNSRSDFLGDKKKSFRKQPSRGMGQYRLYCCPTGLINKVDLPPKWGLIWVSPTGRTRLVVNPFNSTGGKRYLTENKFKYNEQAERKFMYSIIRRMHLRGHLGEIYEPLPNQRTRRRRR